MSVVTTSWWNAAGQLLHSPYRHKGLNSSAVYLRYFSVTELLGIDNWLWLEHDECFCAAEVPQSVSE